MRRLFSALRILCFLLTVALGIFVIYLGYLRFYRSVDAWILILAFIGGGIAASIVCLLFHEIGHLLFGKMCGFRFVSMRIGFLHIRRRGRALALSFGGSDAALAGDTELLPKNTRRVRGKLIAAVLGGLLFSLLFFAGTVVALCLRGQLPLVGYALACTGAPAAFYLFFLNLIPSADGVATDGSMLFGLLCRDPSAMTAVDLLVVEGQLMQGKTPAEIGKEAYYASPQLPEDDLHFILLTEHRFAYYADAGDLAAAAREARRLESVSEYLPESLYAPMMAEVLYARCWIERDAEGAKCLYKPLETYLQQSDTASAKRALAAYYLYAEGNKDAARRILSEAESLIGECFVSGVAAYESKRIAQMRADLA